MLGWTRSEDPQTSHQPSHLILEFLLAFSTRLINGSALARVWACANLPNSIQLSFFTLICQLELNPIQDLMTSVFQSDQWNGSGMGWTYITILACTKKNPCIGHAWPVDRVDWPRGHDPAQRMGRERARNDMAQVWAGPAGPGLLQVNNSNHQTNPMAMIGSQWAPLVQKLKSPIAQSPRMMNPPINNKENFPQRSKAS